MVVNIQKIKECPDCGSESIQHKESINQVICKECGLIYEPMAPKVEKKFKKTHNLK